MEIFILIGIVLAIVQGIGLFLFWKKLGTKLNSISIPTPPAPIVNLNLTELKKSISDVPSKVLASIQSSANNHKGSLGELIGYLELHAKYDRIVPLGNIIDFMCIKFPSKDTPGSVDFVDVKTGQSSRLSKDQRELQRLIKNKQIQFIKLRVQTNTLVPDSDEIKPRES